MDGKSVWRLHYRAVSEEIAIFGLILIVDMAKPILVIKFGSSSITHANGEVNEATLEKIAAQVAVLQPNYHIVLVSSGAVAAGKSVIKNYKGSFGIISTVTNPFCDACNRIRLTANGKLKNCLFSTGETPLLETFRDGKSIEGLIQHALHQKKAVRAGMTELEDFENLENHHNRSMITIGG